MKSPHTFLRTGLCPCLLLSIIFLGLKPRLTDDFVDRLLNRLSLYAQQYPSEKVYLHTDRSVYLPGETIWVKGYLFDGSSHAADSASGVLYVDLVDPSAQRVLLHSSLRVTGSHAPGQLLLPDSLRAGHYLLRGYTGWMRNFPEEFLFTKTLTLLQPNHPLPTPPLARPDVQFLPEGGQLVAGLESRVAFKAVGASGGYVDVEGYVVDAKNDTLVGFSSQHLGMGYFSIKPEPGQAYTAFVRPIGTTAYTHYPMPAVQAQGYVLTVDNISNKDNIKVFIANNKTGSAAQKGTMTLLAQTRGQAIQVATGPVAKPILLINLPRQKFAEGITQLTLFDENHAPVCERLVYINQRKPLTITLTPTKATAKPRARIDLDLRVTDASNQPVMANLSLAVTDAGQLPDHAAYPTTLTSYLLLTSDLTGTVEQPGYYFDPANKDRGQKLDLLLMTQGWRRFTWPSVLRDSLPAARYFVESGLPITGQVLRPNRQPAGVVDITLILVHKDSSRAIMATTSDAQGRYIFPNLDFTDSTKVLVQARGKRGADEYNILLDQLLYPAVTLIRPPFNSLLITQTDWNEFVRRTSEALDIEQQLRRNRDQVMLQEVKVVAKKQVVRDSRKIYSNPEASVKITPELAGGSLTILDILRSRVAGVNVIGSGYTASVQIRGAANFSGIVEPLFILDGQPIDKQTALFLPISTIEQVDVLKGASASIYGSRAAGGVLSILSRQGNPAYDFTKDEAPGTLLTKLPGYAPFREFYAPRYDQPQLDENRPDYRPTLYWQPMVSTDADGKARVSFWASDAKTTLRMVIEGATPDGRPGSGHGLLTVE